VYGSGGGETLLRMTLAPAGPSRSWLAAKSGNWFVWSMTSPL